MTVSDGTGSDTVNFIFRVGGWDGLDSTSLATSGKDVIISTDQSDILTGGAGGDQFVFSDAIGADVITDFVPGQDKIDFLAHFPFTPGDTDSFAQWLNGGAIEQVGSDTLIQIDAENSIRLSHVAKANLQMSDFILHPGVSG